MFELNQHMPRESESQTSQSTVRTHEPEQHLRLLSS